MTKTQSRIYWPGRRGGSGEPGEEIDMSSVEKYLEYMDIGTDDLRGKFILDVGAGYAGFAIECIVEDIAKVVSLDRSPDRYSLQQLRQHERSIPVVRGWSQKLPFRGEIFDLVVSHVAVPMLSKCKEDVQDTLEEMCRVVKPGGEVRIVATLIYKPGEVETWIRDKLLELAADTDMGYEISRTSWFKNMPEFPGKAAEHRLTVIKKKPTS